MDRLEELRSLRRKEMKFYYQKVVPAIAKLRVSTFLGIGLYLIIRYWEMSLGMFLLFSVLQTLIAGWWLFSILEFLIYRVQLNIIQDRVDIIRKDNENTKPN